jgi:hypothetical protein
MVVWIQAIGSLVGALVSVAALAVAYLAFRTAHRAVDISDKGYHQDRRIELGAWLTVLHPRFLIRPDGSVETSVKVTNAGKSALCQLRDIGITLSGGRDVTIRDWRVLDRNEKPVTKADVPQCSSADTSPPYLWLDLQLQGDDWAAIAERVPHMRITAADRRLKPGVCFWIGYDDRLGYCRGEFDQTTFPPIEEISAP